MIRATPIIIALALVAPAFAVDSCRQATTNEFHALPGYAHYAQLVQADFGGRAAKNIDVNGGQKDNNVVRSDGSTDRTAMLCMSGGPFTAAAAAPGDMSCQTNLHNYDGQIDGTTGTISASLTAGYSGEAQWTTTKATTVGVGIKTSIDVGVPAIEEGEAKGSISTTFDVTNEQSSTTKSTIAQTNTFIATATIPKGSTCTMVVNVTSCTLKTSIQVPITFKGMVHNNFDRDVTYSGQGRDNKHTDWWINPAIYGMDPKTELSSIMEVSGSLQTTAYGQAYVKCVDSTGAANSVPVDSKNSNATVPASGGSGSSASATSASKRA